MFPYLRLLIGLNEKNIDNIGMKKQNTSIISPFHHYTNNRVISYKYLSYIVIFITVSCVVYVISYLPTPPLGPNMTQGRFLSGV